jgi:hypothetical protein
MVANLNIRVSADDRMSFGATQSSCIAFGQVAVYGDLAKYGDADNAWGLVEFANGKILKTA